MVGKTILHYKIIEKIGEGGMGVVYKAEDTKLKREVAIKFLPRQISASDEERERFKIEAQAAASLNHPNIATIYAIEEVDGDTYNLTFRWVGRFDSICWRGIAVSTMTSEKFIKIIEYYISLQPR